MFKYFHIVCILFFTTIVYAQPTNKISMTTSTETIVQLNTTQGVIRIRLFKDIAPKTCDNFIQLIEKGYYNGIIFHRVIPNFMIQGGDPTGTGRGGESVWGKDFEDECDPNVKFNKVGLLAMANRGPNTNGSQFFITTAATPWLHMKHTIFGEVIEGYENVQKIEQAPRDSMDKPKATQQIIEATIE